MRYGGSQTKEPKNQGNNTCEIPLLLFPFHGLLQNNKVVVMTMHCDSAGKDVLNTVLLESNLRMVVWNLELCIADKAASCSVG